MNSTISATLERIDQVTGAFRMATTRGSDDKIDLRYGVYTRGAAEPSRYVIFLNGRTEWIEKYSYLVNDLDLKDGTAFLTWDHRGQGASGGARSYVNDYDTYARDSRKIVDEVVGDKPYVIFAHSMGGLISLYSTLTGMLRPRAMVLSSPLLGMPNEPVPRNLARSVAGVLNACHLGTLSSGAGNFTKIPFERNQLTHNVELYGRMQQSPYKIPGATFSWVTATFRALDLCYDVKKLSTLAVPTLVMGGTEEKVVDVTGFSRWVQEASKVAQADVKLRLFQGAKHELFSETAAYYDPAIQAVNAWFRSHQ